MMYSNGNEPEIYETELSTVLVHLQYRQFIMVVIFTQVETNPNCTKPNTEYTLMIVTYMYSRENQPEIYETEMFIVIV